MHVLLCPILSSGQTDVEGGISDRSLDKLLARDSILKFYVLSTGQHFASTTPTATCSVNVPVLCSPSTHSVSCCKPQATVELTYFVLTNTTLKAMKFGSVVLSAALLMTGANAFSVAPSITSIASTRTHSDALKMAASTEFLNGEARPKKTREVSCS